MTESPHSPRAWARSRLPFLGGLVSAALCYLALEDEALQHVAWFALTPFFYSLLRARDYPARRLAQGLLFLGPLGAALYRGDAAPLALGLQAGLFAVAAGPILRSEKTIVRVLGLSVLWSGLEVFRGPMCPAPGALWPGWLCIGSMVRAGSPESLIASWIGLHGISFAVAASSALFTAVLQEARFHRQVLLTALGLSIPIGIYSSGLWIKSGESRAPSTPARCTVATEAFGDDARLFELTRKIPGATNDFAVWPCLRSELDRRENGRLETSCGALEALAKERSSWVLAAARSPAGTGRFVPIRGDPNGTILESAEGTVREPTLFAMSSGTVAVGIEEEFDVPDLSRNAVTRGAQLLVSIGSESPSWREAAVRHRSNLHAYRAIENHRWIVRTSRRAAFVANPEGVTDFIIHGVEGAGAAEAAWRSDLSPYSRRGWWLEPALLAGAGWVLVGALTQWIAHRRRG